MKQIIAYPTSFILWAIGNVLSWFLHFDFLYWIYYPYNWCLQASYTVEKWGRIDFLWSDAYDVSDDTD